MSSAFQIAMKEMGDLIELAQIKQPIIDGINEHLADIDAQFTDITKEISTVFNVKGYGAVGDGVANDNVAIQATIDAVKLAGGGTVFFPPGTYLYTSLTVDFSNVSFIGSGKSSRLLQNSTTGFGITFYNIAGIKEYAQIRNLFFDSLVTKTSGMAIKFLNYKFAIIDSCYFQNQFNSVGFASYQYMFINNCYFQNNSNVDINLTFGDGCYITNCMAQNAAITAGSIGLFMTNAGGTYLVNYDVTNHDYGIRILPPAGAAVQWTFISNSSFDTCNYGLYADTSGGGIINSINSSNSWYSSNVERGIEIGGVDGFSSSNDRIILNHSDGVLIRETTKNVQFNNSQICANGVNPAKGDAGIFALNGADNFSIHGCLISNNYAGSYSYQGVGILIGAGTSDNLIITDNNLLGNGLSSISDGSTGSNRIIKNNLGYATENKGKNTFSGNGAIVAFTIAHGLAKTPSSAFVTPSSTAAKGDYFITVDATNITVTYGTAPITGTSNVILFWSAEV